MSEPLRTIAFDDALAKEFADAEPSQYLYRIRETAELVCVQMAYGECIEREKVGGFLDLPNGQEAVRAWSEELERDGFTPRHRTIQVTRARWPMTSARAGVNPDQIPELREFWEKKHVHGCDVLPNGDIVWNDAAARARDLRARGMYDRDAGYSDPAPVNH